VLHVDCSCSMLVGQETCHRPSSRTARRALGGAGGVGGGEADLSSKASLAKSLPNLTSADVPSTATVGRFAFCARAQSGSRVVQRSGARPWHGRDRPCRLSESGRALHLDAEDDIGRPRRLRARKIDRPRRLRARDTHSSFCSRRSSRQFQLQTKFWVC